MLSTGAEITVESGSKHHYKFGDDAPMNAETFKSLVNIGSIAIGERAINDTLLHHGSLNGTNNSEIINGLDYNDFINAGGGTDTLAGGLDDDTPDCPLWVESRHSKVGLKSVIFIYMIKL